MGRTLRDTVMVRPPLLCCEPSWLHRFIFEIHLRRLRNTLKYSTARKLLLP